MNIRKKRIFSVVICIAFLFVTFASLFYIAKEENHNCIGEDCPICAGIQQAEQVLRTVGNTSDGISCITPILILFATLLAAQSLFISSTSLVSQKVRLNN